MLIRKERAGSTSSGHTWEHDGDVVEVPDEDVPALLAIRDAGFSVVEPKPTLSGADGTRATDGEEQPPVTTEPVLEPAPAPDQASVTEPAPTPENAINEAPAADSAAKARPTRKPKADA